MTESGGPPTADGDGTRRADRPGRKRMRDTGAGEVRVSRAWAVEWGAPDEGFDRFLPWGAAFFC